MQHPARAIAIIGLIALFCAAASPAQDAVRSRAPGQRVRGASGQDIRIVSSESLDSLFTTFRGGVMVVNVWATWCAPCVKEMPALLAAYRQAWRRQGVKLVLLSVDSPRDIRSKVLPFVLRNHIDATVLVKKPGGDQAFIDALHPKWGGGIPVTVVFDRSGVRAALLEGEQDRHSFEEAVAPLLR